RERGRPVILGANKCESTAANAGLYESYSLGFGDPVALSAEHGDGMADLLVALLPYLDAADEAPDDDGENDASRPLQLAIIGRPNTGKSTLVNRLIDEDRLLTGPEAGITRDSITVDWTFDGRPLQLVDTAGLRRRARVSDKLEKLSTVDTMRTIRYANVAVLMLDAAVMLEKQDLTIGRQVIEEGRALVIAANKWDAVVDRDAALRLLRDRLQTSMPQVRGIPVVTISALEGRNLDKLMQAVFSIYDIWNKRVSTARLNAWLDLMIAAHPPPLAGSGRRIRLRYMTQVKSRPPTFAIWASRPEELPDSYQRYLVNGLREDFGFEGVPLRLQFRKGKNPYAPETTGTKGKIKHSSKSNPKRGGKRAARPRMKAKPENT
ncbi:MAG: ribosome biogenesis GTPase Der, partial [Alphaproteobacteria bacterium]|nr:ribosome biogenesis GTPase Der [Alphaproteobacteria bacterium]